MAVPHHIVTASRYSTDVHPWLVRDADSGEVIATFTSYVAAHDFVELLNIDALAGMAS